MAQDSAASGFRARGGFWVAAQMPLLAIAAALPFFYGWARPWARADLATIGGLALLVAGFAITAAGVATLGRALTPFPRPVENSELRTGGIYGIVRHPIYSGILFVAVGWSLYRHSLAGLGFDVLLFAFFDRKAAREERWLLEKFPAYELYRVRVSKLIPWVY